MKNPPQSPRPSQHPVGHTETAAGLTPQRSSGYAYRRCDMQEATATASAHFNRPTVTVLTSEGNRNGAGFRIREIRLVAVANY
jgi:hypothetical protein